MVVAQAAAAFRLFTGRNPDEDFSPRGRWRGYIVSYAELFEPAVAQQECRSHRVTRQIRR